MSLVPATMHSWSSLSTVFLAVVLIYLFHWISTSISNSIHARRLGCKPAFVRPFRFPFGIDILKRYIDATREQIIQNDDLVLYNELGCRPTWKQNILGNWHHVTADPKNIQAILATQFKDFELGPFRRNLFGPVIGHGIFTSDGKEWQHSRALLRPQFSRNQVADLNLEETHVQNLFSRLEIQPDSWTKMVDLAPLFFNLTLDSATEFLFGESVRSQLVGSMSTKSSPQDGELDWSSFGKSFDRANTVIIYQSRLLDFYFLYCPSYFREDCAATQRFADHYVNLALQGELDSSTENSGHYVFLRELVKETRDPNELRSQLLNVLLAGRDTTAGLLGWTFHLLARHPDAYSKLRAVVIETFGTTTSEIKFESLKSCTYLQNVLSEVLRLHPVVPENSRRAVRNTTLPRGGGPDGLSPIYVPAGEEAAYNVHMMHHRRDIWGEDADEFRPERWIGCRPGWEFLPFNGGPRICLGQQFALTEAGYVIARIIQRFDKLDNLDTSTVTKHQYTSTTAPVRVLVRMHQAQE